MFWNAIFIFSNCTSVQATQKIDNWVKLPVLRLKAKRMKLAYSSFHQLSAHVSPHRQKNLSIILLWSCESVTSRFLPHVVRFAEIISHNNRLSKQTIFCYHRLLTYENVRIKTSSSSSCFSFSSSSLYDGGWDCCPRRAWRMKKSNLDRFIDLVISSRRFCFLRTNF